MRREGGAQDLGHRVRQANSQLLSMLGSTNNKKKMNLINKTEFYKLNLI